MKIKSITLSVFEKLGETGRFNLVNMEEGSWRYWSRVESTQAQGVIHVMHVTTDDGVEGMCTVGDARYRKMLQSDLDHLRHLAVGEDPLDRERLNSKLSYATRFIFIQPGWFGAFDNCLWDIAGKVSGMSVCRMLGRARSEAPAYYNYGGKDKKAAIEDAHKALDMGFSALKDHFSGRGRENVAWSEAVREAIGPNVELLHDAAVCTYTFEEAVQVGRALEQLGFLWFEEPLPDRDMIPLQRLCAALDISVMALESMMHDLKLSATWLIKAATDRIRANARHGVTSLVKLAHMAELHNTTVELNGPGGLFGLVHSHMMCAIGNTTYYEYFPCGSRDEAGKEIGLLNPPVPVNGRIAPPEGPGWGADWDRSYFEKIRTAVL